LDLSNSHPTNFCCQLLRCLVCIVSWCTRSVHAMNDRVKTAVYTAVFGSWTDHVQGPCTAVYTVCTWPWTTVYMGRKHDRIHGRVPVHGRVYGSCTGPPMYRVHDQCLVQTMYTAVHGPCTWSVHDPYTAVYVYVFRLRKVYTAVHGRVPRVRTVNTAVDRVHGCSRPCTRPVHGRVQGPYRAMYTGRKKCRVHGL